MIEEKEDIERFASYVGRVGDLKEYDRKGQDVEIKMVVDDYMHLQKRLPHIFKKASMNWGYADNPSVILQTCWMVIISKTQIAEPYLYFKDDGTWIFEIGDTQRIIMPSEKEAFIDELPNLIPIKPKPALHKRILSRLFRAP